jgi:hypothetical protein
VDHVFCEMPGRVSAPALSGPWKRLSAHNPVPLDAQHGVENPVVTRLHDGRYIAVWERQCEISRSASDLLLVECAKEWLLDKGD